MCWQCFLIFSGAFVFYGGTLVAGFVAGHLVGSGRAFAAAAARYHDLLNDPEKYERERVEAFEEGRL